MVEIQVPAFDLEPFASVEGLPQSCGENIPTHVHTAINLLGSYLIKLKRLRN
jgi:hypothetical protein